MPASDVSLDALRGALARDELVYHYQPKVSMVHGDVCGAEALLRWCRPDGTTVPPGEFIPLAESSGFITEITLAMLDKLVEDLVVLRAVDPRLVVSFNVTAQDLEDGRLVTAMLRHLDQGRLARGSIEVELTESSVLTAGPALIERLGLLRRRGVSLAMDDFGTGYSSIDMLSKLPFSTLKLDQGVVLRMEASEKDATIVESSIRMGHRLGLEIVAEGIESEPVFLRLQGAGCTVAQGYWIGRAEPLAGFVGFLRARRHWPAGSIGLLHMAMLDHLEWRKALVDSLISTQAHGEPLTAAAARRFEMEPTDCRLGRWYHGPGRQLGEIPAFRAVAEPHTALHACGKRIVAATGRGARFSELAPVLRELTGHSTRIIGLLQELEHAVLVRLIEAEQARIQAPLPARSAVAVSTRVPAAG